MLKLDVRRGSFHSRFNCWLRYLEKENKPILYCIGCTLRRIDVEIVGRGNCLYRIFGKRLEINCSNVSLNYIHGILSTVIAILLTFARIMEPFYRCIKVHDYFLVSGAI